MLGHRKRLWFIALLTLLGLAFFIRAGQAQKPKAAKTPPKPAPKTQIAGAAFNAGAPFISRAVGFAETEPMRDLAAAEAASTDASLTKKDAEEINEFNSSHLFNPDPKAPMQKDGALQSAPYDAAITIPGPTLTFEGIPVQNTAPPDTTGAVGPNDYVQGVNSLIRVFDKNGVPRGPAFKLSTLFAALGGIVANTDNGDPIVLYDRMANRWLITEFSYISNTVPPFHQAVAISKTGDPTGAYWVYDFLVGGPSGNEFPDYSKWGAWPDAYYNTVRQFTAPSGSYNGFGCFAYDRAKMLVGDPTATYIYFNAGPNLSNSSSGMIPTDFMGLIPPPAGAPNVFAVSTDDAFGDPSDAIRLFDFHADFATPANSTFTERPGSPLPVAAFDSRNPNVGAFGRADIEEPAPATAADYLDSIGDRLMLRLLYINRGGTQYWTTCHTVNAGTIPAPGIAPTVAQYKAATRYYVLQQTTPGGAITVQDQGTFSPDSTERWMGSTSFDNAGNLAVGYSTSSTTVFPSIAYAGRLLNDPPGTLAQGEATMFAGTGVQLGTQNRWGDYSNMSTDPSDDATFWYTNEYYSTSPAAGFAWQTRVGKFKFAGTTAPAQGTLSGTVAACDSGALLKDALVQVTGGPSTGFSTATAPNGTYSMNLAPGNYSVTISNPAHKCMAIGPFNVTITNGGNTVQNGCLSGTPAFLYSTSTVSVTGGNGNGVVEPNECNNINVAILNNGCAIGTGVSAVLSTSTPGVTVTQPNSPYPDTTENGTSLNVVPFSFSTSNTFQCGTTINFTLTVTSTGGGANTFTFSLPSCNLPPQVVNGALTASDLQQPNGRLGRNGVVSVCGTLKTCPGLLGAGARLYDQLSFTNGPAPACVKITTTQSCPTPANDIIPAAYLGSYDPNNICTNYLGDPGGSPGAVPNVMQVDLPANATLVVVVQEANAGLAGCSGYTVTVEGLVGNGSGTATCPPPPTAVSRKTHGGAGTFDIPLPLTGPVGVEDRVGNSGVAGNHTIVLTYPTSPAGATAAVVARNPSGATGSVSNVTINGNDMIVTLANVSDQQVLTLSATGGNVSPAVVPIGFLVGDANGNHSVSASDIAQVKAQAGPVTGANFRSDVNTTGDVNATDISITKAKAGGTIP
jgi:hypothetical protein